MKILIAGATGLIGRELVVALSHDCELTVLGRDLHKLHAAFPDLAAYNWQQIDDIVFADYDAVINLAGENIGERRWSHAQKQRIIDSRVQASQLLAHACAKLGANSPRLLNASAIGIYGLAAPTHTEFTEESVIAKTPTDFLSAVGQRWENALLPAEQAGVKLIKLRFSVVLAAQGGALAKMLPSFKYGVGAVIGHGQQVFSWVSLHDAIRAITFLLNAAEAQGPYNIVAPEVISQQVFAKTLAQALKRPCCLRLPAAMIKLLFGQMGDELLLQGQTVRAARLSVLGFTYDDQTLQQALHRILAS